MHFPDITSGKRITSNSERPKCAITCSNSSTLSKHIRPRSKRISCTNLTYSVIWSTLKRNTRNMLFKERY